MSSTNKTTNYELSQFVGSDKPAWLGDYNTDMSKIDAQMKVNADAATSASGAASAASTSVGDISQLTTTDKTNAVAAINEVKTTADTAANTAAAASTTANSANSKADTALNGIAKFNLDTFGNCTVTSTHSGSTTTITDHDLKFAKNSDGSLFKVYGYVQLSNMSGQTGDFVLTISGLGLPVDAEYQINAICTAYYKYGQASSYDFITERPAVVKSNGTLQITLNNAYGDISGIRLILPPCLYFNTNFGD